MPVTIKVNGTVNSLVHKGSNHISAATIPDVCKTPTPGGPVPLPYPNISQSSTLDKGTKTVKADGGMMIAIKGSEFSMSNGDEPGSIGGVKSNTFIKESTWILYSFDVKVEGEGACRLSDKKFQNHENTADMMGAVGAPVSVGGTNLMDIDCANFKSDVRPNGFSDCEKKQICAKCDEVNKQAEAGQLKRRTGQDQIDNRNAGDNAAATLRRQWEASSKLGAPITADVVAEYTYHPCAVKEWKDGGRDPGMRNPMFDPDHVHEVQLGGAPSSIGNLKWMSGHANRWMGRKLQDFNTDPGGHTGVKPNCC